MRRPRRKSKFVWYAGDELEYTLDDSEDSEEERAAFDEIARVISSDRDKAKGEKPREDSRQD